MTPISSLPTSVPDYSEVGLFWAYLSGSAPSYAIANTNKIFDAGTWTERYDYDGWYNTSNRRYTPQRAGWYRIDFGVQMGSSISAGHLQARVYFNGSTSDSTTLFGSNDSEDGSSGQYNASTGTGMKYFNGSTDYCELGMHASWTGTELMGAYETTFMAGHFVFA